MRGQVCTWVDGPGGFPRPLRAKICILARPRTLDDREATARLDGRAAEAADDAVSVTAPIYGEPLERCVACESRLIERWRDKTYAYSRKDDGPPFSIFRCGDCGTGFLNPPPHKGLLESIYAHSGHALQGPVTLEEVLDREQRFPNSTVDARRIARNSRRLDRSGILRALDVGSGYGFLTRELRVAGYDTVSINPGRYENAVFVHLNGTLPEEVMFDRYEPMSRFGVVVMSQVLEHIVAPSKAVAKVRDLLEPRGVFACTVPNFRSWSVRLRGVRDNSCLWVPEHVNFFSERGLTRLLERHGFTLMHREYFTRILPDAITSRISLPMARTALGRVISFAQVPVTRLFDRLSIGSYLGVYATPT